MLLRRFGPFFFKESSVENDLGFEFFVLVAKKKVGEKRPSRSRFFLETWKKDEQEQVSSSHLSLLTLLNHVVFVFVYVKKRLREKTKKCCCVLMDARQIFFLVLVVVVVERGFYPRQRAARAFRVFCVVGRDRQGK